MSGVEYKKRESHDQERNHFLCHRAARGHRRRTLSNGRGVGPRRRPPRIVKLFCCVPSSVVRFQRRHRSGPSVVPHFVPRTRLVSPDCRHPSPFQLLYSRPELRVFAPESENLFGTSVHVDDHLVFHLKGELSMGGGIRLFLRRFVGRKLRETQTDPALPSCISRYVVLTQTSPRGRPATITQLLR